MKCVKCKQKIEANSPFCGNCGAKVKRATKFCGGCGTELDKSAKFCGSCGKTFGNKKEKQQEKNEPIENISVEQIKEETPFVVENPVLTEVQPQYQQDQQTVQPVDTANISSAISSIKQKLVKLKPHIIKHKIPIIVVTSIVILLIVGWTCYQNFYDFTKLSWVETYGDYKVTHISGGTLTLKVEAYDKEDALITDIKYTATGGELAPDGTKVAWTLPSEEGIYKITAETPSGKKVTKEVEIVKIASELDNPLPTGVTTATEEETDNDKDGLLNDEEIELGTNPNSADTDADGLTDSFEINESKTKPLSNDTDIDGIYDGDELDLGLDPLKSDSKGDGIKDGDRELIYTVENENLDISIKITGKGNIASTTIDVLSNSTFKDMEGLLDKVYNFYTDGTINNAIVTIKYDENEIKEQGLEEDNLTLYYFNEETKQLESMPTEVDTKKNVIKVTLNHFSKYVIGDKNVVLVDSKAQILFVIDNSVSMYSEQQMIDAGYNSSTGAIGNDTEFKRFTLTNKLVEMFTGNYEFAVSEFSGNYVKLQDFSTSSSSTKTAVYSMKSNWKSSADGTDIIEALQSGIGEFKEDNNSHYLVLMTDGKNTEGDLSYHQDSIIQSAKNKNIKVCVIGLGTDLDTDVLDEIAEETGCDYYHASNSSALDEIYSLVGADINYNLVDTNDDGKTDGMIVADSGFITTRDGFSFDNFVSVQSDGGNCYGMAMFSMLYYMDKLPMSLGYFKDSAFFINGGFVTWEATGYNLDNTYFETGKPLYEYDFQDEAVKMRLQDFPSDARNKIEDGIYYVNEKYYDLFSNIGIEFDLKKYEGEIEGVKKYQSVGYIDVENEKFIKNADNDDVQLLKAIWRLFTIQMNDEEYGFGSNPDKTYTKLVENLENGIPMVISVRGNHAINAVRLIQDLEDANKFKLEVYDNNYPGEIRYIEITRKKYSKFQLSYTAWTNEYNYTFEYDGDEISVSLSEAEVN